MPNIETNPVAHNAVNVSNPNLQVSPEINERPVSFVQSDPSAINLANNTNDTHTIDARLDTKSIAIPENGIKVFDRISQAFQSLNCVSSPEKGESNTHEVRNKKPSIAGSEETFDDVWDKASIAGSDETLNDVWDKASIAGSDETFDDVWKKPSFAGSDETLNDILDKASIAGSDETFDDVLDNASTEQNSII